MVVVESLRAVSALLALVVTFTLSACSSTSPTAPTPSGASAGAVIAVKVVSEMTGAPIIGAFVSTEKPKLSGVTNAEGKISFEGVEPTSRIEIVAHGYLTRVASLSPSGEYGLLGPRGDVSDAFIQEVVMGDALGRGNTSKPRKNRIDIVLENEVFWTEEIMRAHNNVCARIQAVGFGCDIYREMPARNGTLVVFRYGGESGQTELVWHGAGTDHIYTMRGDFTMQMRNEPTVISKMVTAIGLRHHSWPSGAASKVRASADFSDWEKQAIALYLPRQEETCFEDKVKLPVPGYFGANCQYQVPFR